MVKEFKHLLNEYLLELDNMYKELDDERKLCFIHGDIHTKNMIISKDDFYLIDWELATYGDLAYELAMHFILMEYTRQEKDIFFSKLVKNIDLDLDLEEVSIYQDKTLLAHVWSNLIGNAIKYSNNNSKIENTEPCYVTYTNEETKKIILENKKGDAPQKTQQQPKLAKGSDILEVDLHAEQLLETTAGMNAFDILNHQLDVVRRTLDENIKYKGKKIVFIHGKGEGVLRNAIGQELRKKYPRCLSQDASFQKYGFGATMVIIK